MNQQTTMTLRRIGLLTALLASATVQAAPTVSLTAPLVGTYNTPAELTLKASAKIGTGDTGAKITRVDFYANGSLIGSDTSAPYSFTWVVSTPNTYQLTAQATDSLGQSTLSAARTVTIAANNTAPTVSLTAPANNAKYALPADITLSANASDLEKNDGVAQVELLANGQVLATLTAKPYSYLWSNPPAGTHSLTARATDTRGAVTESAARTLTITASNTPPTVSLSSPANNATYQLPADIPLKASASGGELNTPVTRVDFLVNGQIVATLTQAPWNTTWTPVQSGTVTLVARATDNLGQSTDSTSRTLTLSESNQPPKVSLGSPSNNAIFTKPATITLKASASAPEANGSVTQVEFLANGQVIGSDNSSAYSLDWNDPPAGSYTLQARATDEQGAVTLSNLRKITVLDNQAPSITLTSPTANQNYLLPATIGFTATVADPENKLAKVEYLANGQIVATSYSAPYSADWTPGATGTYQITAVATDELGLTASTAPIGITVSQAGPQIRYVHTDHLGTPRAITDQNNTTIWRNLPTTEPFGTSAPEEDPDNDGTAYTFNLRFPGQYADKETNTNYNYFRDYDPSTGRYVQSDPIGLAGGINTYAYVGGNPLSDTDPTGEIGLAGGVAVGAALIVGGAVLMSALPKPKPKPSGDAFPGAANDPTFGGGSCPPDCNGMRMALNRAYLALVASDKLNFPGFNMLKWSWFWVQVKLYEQDCGPYTPPGDDLHDIYGK